MNKQTKFYLKLIERRKEVLKEIERAKDYEIDQIYMLNCLCEEIKEIIKDYENN